jgi:hypothetical protein
LNAESAANEEAGKRARALKWVEVDALIAFQRALEVGKPVKVVDGLTAEFQAGIPLNCMKSHCSPIMD